MQHGVDEAFMPGHVDKAQHATVCRGLVGKAQVDGDASGLLLFQAVGVYPRQCLDERGLAMVDVTCCADYHRVKPSRV